MPFMPEVANGMIFFPDRSYCSRNVLMIVGAIYHHIRIIKLVSYKIILYLSVF